VFVLAKKKTETVKRVATKRQISHIERQKRRQRLIRIFGITVIAAVVVLLLSGLYFQWYLPDYKPLKQTVVKVNDVEFDTQYFIDYLEVQLGDYALYVQYFIDSGLSNLERGALIKEYAAELGITVSDKEVRDYVNENELPNNQVAKDLARTQLLVTKLRDDYFQPQFPTSTNQRHALAMFLESQKQAEDVITRLNAGEDFGTIAAELSLESTTKSDSGDLGFRPQGIIDGLLNTTGLDDAVFGAGVGTFNQLPDNEKSKSLGYWLVKVLERNEETGEVNTQGMLLPSLQAEDALDRLNNGEDFATLAEEISQHGVVGEKADLGWLLAEDVTQPFKDYVFDEDTEIGVVSDPIADTTSTTTGGCWVYKVAEEAAAMDISEENMNILVSNALNDWVTEITNDPDNEITSYLDDDMRAFIINKVAGY
jgi:hypothetical protein